MGSLYPLGGLNFAAVAVVHSPLFHIDLSPIKNPSRIMMRSHPPREVNGPLAGRLLVSGSMEQNTAGTYSTTRTIMML